MAPPPVSLIEPWLRALEHRDQTVSDEERGWLADLIVEPTEVPRGHDLVRMHDRPTRSTLMLQGWAARYIDLPDGRRQILALHLPGDFVDLHSFPLHRMDHSVLAVTPCVVGYAPHPRLRHLTEARPHLARLLWVSTLIDSAILRQWLLGAGQRTALERLAHLICELKVRLEIIGMAENQRLPAPLTQVELGQILGITPVHANRIIQEMRAKGLVRWRDWTLDILDEDRLHEIAQFDPTYLHLEREAR